MTQKTPSILYWNRSLQREEKEKVYGDQLLKSVYGNSWGNSLGLRLADKILTHPFLSKLYGLYQSSSLSRRKIRPFIKNFQIPMSEFEEGPFSSFNDFFIRRFKKNSRTMTQNPNEMPAFAEGRYLAFDRIKEEQTFPVKGKFLSIEKLLGKKEMAQPFLNGPMLIARLCPSDYHRFHYPDDGITTNQYRVHGKLHSVNPMALAKKNDIFLTNERCVSILKTKNFGLIAFMEVGALCVGKIIQTHDVSNPFYRGEEKGYFLFGGSTIIVLGETGAWVPSQDILENTQRKLETLVRWGDVVGSDCPTNDKITSILLIE